MEKLDALAIAAHPDDIELTCAGTMIKLASMGYKTGVIALTAGELGTKGTPEVRRKEFETASEIMGLGICRILDIPDGKVQVSDKNKIKIVREIRALKPKIIFAPYWKTRHPDHGHCSILVRESAYFAGLKHIDTGQQPYRPHKVIYYMELYDFKPSFIIDVSETFDLKIKAIQAYASQFYTGDDRVDEKDETYIGTPAFLQFIVTRGQYWGDKIGARYGEPFLVREPLQLDDPVRHFEKYTFAGLL